MSKIKDIFKAFRVSKKEHLFESFSREYDANPNRQLIIFGAGNEGKQFARLLREYGINPTLFWDNDVRKHGTHVMGIPVAQPTPPPIYKCNIMTSLY